jgi:hypothetical protein
MFRYHLHIHTSSVFIGFLLYDDDDDDEVFPAKHASVAEKSRNIFYSDGNLRILSSLDDILIVSYLRLQSLLNMTFLELHPSSYLVNTFQNILQNIS